MLESYAKSIEDLLHNYQTLKVEYLQKSSDFDDQVNSRREWQKKFEAEERAHQLTRQSIVSSGNPKLYGMLVT